MSPASENEGTQSDQTTNGRTPIKCRVSDRLENRIHVSAAPTLLKNEFRRSEIRARDPENEAQEQDEKTTQLVRS
jgi:hypothetical protein